LWKIVEAKRIIGSKVSAPITKSFLPTPPKIMTP
jgi:hypothetical protein